MTANTKARTVRKQEQTPGIIVPQFFNLDALKFFQKQPDNKYRFAMTSPPYFGKLRRYGGRSGEMDLAEYCAWQVQVIAEACRVTDGNVLWVVNNPVKKGVYQPANERIIVALHAIGLVVKRPIIWHKNAGSSPKGMLRNDYEQILVVSKVGARDVCHWDRIAEPPKYQTGGRYRQRNQVGSRVIGGRYPQNDLANPGDVWRVTVGGGQMGFDGPDGNLACGGYAPFPYKLADMGVKVFSDEGDLVCDPMMGTGTVGAVCVRTGRYFEGNDYDANVVKLARKRIGRAIQYPDVPEDD